MATSASAHGDGSSRRSDGESTLDDVMHAPSRAPDVRVLSRLPDGLDKKDVLNPKEDLWLTTVDGRYSSPIIPIHVGSEPHQEFFQVHKSVLLKSEWFRKALCGGFMESTTQSLHLPEEDPAIFHFIVAYLYEDRYVPTKALSTVLVPDEDKGKRRESETSESGESDSDSSTSSLRSNSTARSLRRRERNRLRDEREAERLRQKRPGMHRPRCVCPQCVLSSQPCLSCGYIRRVPRLITPPLPPPVAPPPPRASQRHRRQGPHGRPIPRAPSPPSPSPPPYNSARIQGEDMHTWLMAYELNIDVYICADKFLLDGFKSKVAHVIIDMLEIAGSDAAETEVLRLCTKLYDGISEDDSLLKMVFARVGFLQGEMWRRAPSETNQFLVDNPEIGALILKEMAIRGERDLRSGIPSMERDSLPPPPPQFPSTIFHHYRPPQHVQRHGV